MNENQVIKKAMDIWYKHAIEREGKRNIVYADSLGKPTVGIGHLVLWQDNLKLGDRISDDRVKELFEKDSQIALNAAIKQAKETKRFNPEWLAALISVNFQLGTNWTGKFKNTWAALVRGDYMTAVQGVKSSLWAKQTPVRTADFVDAIMREYG